MSTKLRMTGDALPDYYEAVTYFIEDGMLYWLYPGEAEYREWGDANQAALFNILDEDKFHWGL